MKKKTQSEMMDSLMTAAFNAENGGNDMERGSYMNEKTQYATYNPPYAPAHDNRKSAVGRWLRGMSTLRTPSAPPSAPPSERGIVSMYRQSTISGSNSTASSDPYYYNDGRNDPMPSWPPQAGFRDSDLQPPRPAYGNERESKWSASTSEVFDNAFPDGFIPVGPPKSQTFDNRPRDN
jgi:hypothetical protein